MGFFEADFVESLYDSSMEYAPIAPTWFVLPLAMIALLVVAAHMIVLREHAIGKMPESRRQIRMMTGWIMMFTIPLTAYGFGIATPSDQQAFATIWSCIVGLLALIVLMACIDAVNSMRIAKKQTRELRNELSMLLNPERKG